MGKTKEKKESPPDEGKGSRVPLLHWEYREKIKGMRGERDGGGDDRRGIRARVSRNETEREGEEEEEMYARGGRTPEADGRLQHRKYRNDEFRSRRYES